MDLGLAHTPTAHYPFWLRVHGCEMGLSTQELNFLREAINRVHAGEVEEVLSEGYLSIPPPDFASRTPTGRSLLADLNFTPKVIGITRRF